MPLESERIIVVILISVWGVSSEAQAKDLFVSCHPLRMQCRNSLQLSKEHSNTLQSMVFHDIQDLPGRSPVQPSVGAPASSGGLD